MSAETEKCGLVAIISMSGHNEWQVSINLTNIFRLKYKTAEIVRFQSRADCDFTGPAKNELAMTHDISRSTLNHILGLWQHSRSINLFATAAMVGAHSWLRGHI